MGSKQLEIGDYEQATTKKHMAGAISGPDGEGGAPLRIEPCHSTYQPDTDRADEIIVFAIAQAEEHIG